MSMEDQQGPKSGFLSLVKTFFHKGKKTFHCLLHRNPLMEPSGWFSPLPKDEAKALWTLSALALW